VSLPNNHTFDKIRSSDFNLGQRYDLIVTANASFTHGTDFWTHFLARTDSCTTTNISSTLGIIRYDNASITLPYTPIDDRQNFGCAEPPLASLAPVVKEAVGNPINGITPAQYLNISLRGYPDVNNGSSYLNKWLLQRQSMVINWSVPTLSLLTSTNSTDGSNFPPSTVPIFLPYEQGDWVYFLIEGNFTPTDPATIHTVPSGHPMHLHGHDFRILDQKDVPFDIETFTPDLDNPPKRDTAMVPQGGYLMIAFQMDNPGAWLMHCREFPLFFSFYGVS
jgi:FtsP/CotA-like multicopper oxidase with cupredoxin domain